LIFLSCGGSCAAIHEGMHRYEEKTLICDLKEFVNRDGALLKITAVFTATTTKKDEQYGLVVNAITEVEIF
jgi:hypothetical protein